eukprot:TRINITY_DN7036_c0_g1_i4.p1 TRINITY_DN7036_c0_g1~~TRINITY_DN7036_c0_g1_i4.p1  ORF type:complete len:1118 (-),score=148.62 TRINITY_DN7036_c0_g1_i4:27-3218(-)
MESPQGALSQEDCYCKSGFFYSKGLCRECTNEGVVCDFLQLRNRTVPFSTSGFYMTSESYAEKCSVTLADDKSVCLGNHIFGQRENASCATGHTGLLCGACETSFSRDSPGTTCSPCADLYSSDASIYSALLCDLFLRACFVLFVAKRAVDGSMSIRAMDAVLIRILMEWVAINSVLQVFDLSRMATLPWHESSVSVSADGRLVTRMNFPEWTQEAWGVLAGIGNVVPQVASSTMATECWAYKTFGLEEAGPLRAKILAPTLWFFLYPILVLLVAFTLSLLAVKVLHPMLTWIQGYRLRRRVRRALLQAGADDSIVAVNLRQVNSRQLQQLANKEGFCRASDAKLAELGLSEDVKAKTLAWRQAQREDLTVADEGGDDVDHAISHSRSSVRGEASEQIFGVFRSTRLRDIIADFVPVVTVGLYVLWTHVTTRLVLSLNATPISFETAEGYTSQQRWVGDTRLITFEGAHRTVGFLAIVGLVIWSFAYNFVLLGFVAWHRKDLHAPRNAQNFGFFVNGLEGKWFFWDLLVKRLDILLVHVVVYSQLIPDVRAKLLCLAGIAGSFYALHSATHPFDKRQCGLLDRVEEWGLGVRFFTFLAIEFILLLNTKPMVTFALVIVLILTNAHYVLTMLLLITIELVQKLEAKLKDVKGDTQTLSTRLLSCVKRLVRLVLLFPRVCLTCRKIHERAAVRFLWTGWLQPIRVFIPDMHRMVKKRCLPEAMFYGLILWWTRRVYKLGVDDQQTYAVACVSRMLDHLMSATMSNSLPQTLIDVIFILARTLHRIDKKNRAAAAKYDSHIVIQEFAMVVRQMNLTGSDSDKLEPSRQSLQLGMQGISEEAMASGVTCQELTRTNLFLEKLHDESLISLLQACLEELENGTMVYGPEGTDEVQGKTEHDCCHLESIHASARVEALASAREAHHEALQQMQARRKVVAEASVQASLAPAQTTVETQTYRATLGETGEPQPTRTREPGQFAPAPQISNHSSLSLRGSSVGGFAAQLPRDTMAARAAGLPSGTEPPELGVRNLSRPTMQSSTLSITSGNQTLGSALASSLTRFSRAQRL